MISRIVVSTLVGAGLLHASVPAAAQELEEIIVTARKREESILKVPVIATALTQESLEKFQTHDLYAVANRVPGFVMSESVGTVGIQASLRGIGPTSQTATVDQSVSLNIDGLALTQGYAFAVGMFDVAQVEVLKGPQALFYGKNSTAGVISLHSADPTDEFELIARGGYESEAVEKVGELIVSGPVADSVKLRLAMRYSDQDGFFRNNGEPVPDSGNLPPTRREFAPKQSLFLRGTALFQSAGRYDARLKLGHADETTDGSGGDGQVIFCPDGTGGVPPVNFPFMGDSDCRLDRYTQLGEFDPEFWPGVRNGGVPFIDARQTFGTLEQNFSFSPAIVLTAVTGLYNITQDNLIRGSGSSNSTIAADYRFRNRQYTQELRLTSAFTDTPVNFMVGAFYQDASIEVDNQLRGNTALGLPPLLQSGVQDLEIRSISAFGQLLWRPTPHFEIAGGARWTEEEREHAVYNALTGSEVDLLVPRISASNLSPELTLTYTPTDALTLFASYRQGFKSGSFNTITVPDENTRADFRDERAAGGEAGLKTRLLDGGMLLNLAGYYYRYSDLQVGANDLSDTGAILLRTINAASADVAGVEFDASYQLRRIAGLSLHGAANYNRARYKTFDNAPCGNGQTIAEGCDRLRDPATDRFTSQDLSGRPLVRAPDWTANLGFDYETIIAGDLTLALGSTTRYSSKFFHNLIALPEYVQDGYFKTSANVAVRGRENAWEIALIGNNLGNEITAAGCANANIQNGTVFGGQVAGAEEKGPAGSDELYCIPERGREVWMRFTWRL